MNRRCVGILPDPRLYLFLGLGSASVLAGGSNHHRRQGRARHVKTANGETRAITAASCVWAFQLNKKVLNAVDKSDQTSPSLMIPSVSSSFPRATPCHASWKTGTQTLKLKQCRGLLTTRCGHGACLPLLFRGDFKSYVFCYPSVDPLIIVIQVMLKFLRRLGKGLWACKTIPLHGNESTMWRPLNSPESSKQMLLPMFWGSLCRIQK